MGGVEGGNLDSRGETPGRIYDSFPPYGLLRIVNVSLEGAAVHPVSQPWSWAPLCDNLGCNKGTLSLRPARVQERGGY